MLRDGVGESQVEPLLEIECEQIKDACVDLGAPNTLMVVICLEKRHNIRIFPDDRGRGRDSPPQCTRNGNVLPGTLVEGLFTGHSLNDNPYQDFLLVSHSGSIGTVRGVRHSKVVDEVGLTPEEVQRMMYHLTFLMCRSTRSVSLPAALFYADLAAKLARCVLKYEGPDGSDSSLRRGYLARGSARVERGGDSSAPLAAAEAGGGGGDPLSIMHMARAGVSDFYSMTTVHDVIAMKQYFV